MEVQRDGDGDRRCGKNQIEGTKGDKMERIMELNIKCKKNN